jgi:hypothetical protein
MKWICGGWDLEERRGRGDYARLAASFDWKMQTDLLLDNAKKIYSILGY